MTHTTASLRRKDQQRRRSPVRRRHHEGPRRFGYRPIGAMVRRRNRFPPRCYFGLSSVTRARREARRRAEQK